MVLGDVFRFGGRSFMGLRRDLLAHTRTQERQNITFVIRTTQRDGLVFWQGGVADRKLMGKDFMSVSLEDGYIMFRY